MSDVVLVRAESGKVEGLGEKGARAYARFKKHVEQMDVGETLAFSWKAPRSPKFHRLFFATLNALFDRQEQFDKLESLRAWITVGAGRYMTVPGPTGRQVAIPESIAWDKMDDVEFYDFFMDVDRFMESEHCGSFLWPHLAPPQRQEMIEQLLTEFRQDRTPAP